MERTMNLRTLLCVLLAALALPHQGSLSLPEDCSTIDDVGNEFSVTELSCVDYTAQFTWSLDLSLADTRLELQCHNDSDEFAPDIQETGILSRSESHSIPLRGVVHCQLAGCYRHHLVFQNLLIPATAFDCLPPPSLPAITTSQTTTMSPSRPPSASLSPSHPPSASLSPSHPPSIITTTVTPTISPILDQQGRRLEMIAAIGLSALAFVFLILILGLTTLCIYRRQRQTSNFRDKYFMKTLQNNKVDPGFNPPLQSYNLNVSTMTILEPPAPLHTIDKETAPTPLHESDGETDGQSVDSIHHVMSSIQTETAEDMDNTVHSDCTQHFATVDQPTTVPLVERHETPIDAHPNATSSSTYVCEPISLGETTLKEETSCCLEAEEMSRILVHNTSRIPNSCSSELLQNEQKVDNNYSHSEIFSTHCNKPKTTLLSEETLNSPRDLLAGIDELITPQLQSPLADEEEEECEEVLNSFAGNFAGEHDSLNHAEKLTEQQCPPHTSTVAVYVNSSGLSTGTYLHVH